MVPSHGATRDRHLRVISFFPRSRYLRNLADRSTLDPPDVFDGDQGRHMNNARATALSTRRPPICWEDHHDNGWTTPIVEQDDGSYAAWAMTGAERSSMYVDTDIGTRTPP